MHALAAACEEQGLWPHTHEAWPMREEYKFVTMPQGTHFSACQVG